MFESISKVVMGIILLKELCVWTVCVCVCESCECETQLPKNGMSVCADQCTAFSLAMDKTLKLKNQRTKQKDR